jgi:hypothetical protein
VLRCSTELAAVAEHRARAESKLGELARLVQRHKRACELVEAVELHDMRELVNVRLAEPPWMRGVQDAIRATLPASDAEVFFWRAYLPIENTGFQHP